MPVTYVRKAVTDPILQVADKLAPKIARSYLDAVDVASTSITMKELIAAIDRGESEALIIELGKKFADALEGIGLAADALSVRDALQLTYGAAAKVAISELPKSVSIELSFNLINPEAVKFLDSNISTLVKDVTAETRAALQQILSRGYAAGESPAVMAREIKDIIGLSANQEKALANYRNALEAGDIAGLRDALSRSLRDGRYDKGLLNALQNDKGLSQKRIDTMVDRYRERQLAYRATSIARTQSVRASNAGQRETWRQAREQGLLDEDVQREWEASGDDRTCDECEALDGETAGLDEEFAPGIMQPPDPHDNCRCTTKLHFRKAKAA